MASENLVNKATLGEMVSEKFALPKNQGLQIVEFLIDKTLELVKAGKKVSYYGLVTFEMQTRKARNGINPKTKERIQIPEKKTMKCKVAKQVKDSMK